MFYLLIMGAGRLLLRWNYSLSSKSRGIKFDLFWSLMKPWPGCSVLNLGATPPHLGEALVAGANHLVEQPEQDLRWRTLRVVGCNLTIECMQQYRREHKAKGFSGIVANGCELPFGDKSFDIVFSNAVIEHVTLEQQRLMAAEIMRVGHSWFVTTPNFWYPIEMHHKIPFFQFLPEGAKRAIQRKFRTWPEGEPINLLTGRELQQLLPGSTVIKTRVTFFPETLIAYQRTQVPVELMVEEHSPCPVAPIPGEI